MRLPGLPSTEWKLTSMYANHHKNNWNSENKTCHTRIVYTMRPLCELMHAMLTDRRIPIDYTQMTSLTSKMFSLWLVTSHLNWWWWYQRNKVVKSIIQFIRNKKERNITVYKSISEIDSTIIDSTFFRFFSSSSSSRLRWFPYLYILSNFPVEFVFACFYPHFQQNFLLGLPFLASSRRSFFWPRLLSFHITLMTKDQICPIFIFNSWSRSFTSSFISFFHSKSLTLTSSQSLTNLVWSSFPSQMYSTTDFVDRMSSIVFVVDIFRKILRHRPHWSLLLSHWEITRFTTWRIVPFFLLRSDWSFILFFFFRDFRLNVSFNVSLWIKYDTVKLNQTDDIFCNFTNRFRNCLPSHLSFTFSNFTLLGLEVLDYWLIRRRRHDNLQIFEFMYDERVQSVLLSPVKKFKKVQVITHSS